MLNLSKKNKYPQIVQEIHNEFFTAGDNILMEANAVLEECMKKDINKGKRLLSLGFKKVPQAVQGVETESQLIKSKEIAQLVLYYKVNYPNNKFITEEQVKSICEKYNLICGDVSMYKGFVPEKNIIDIERFKLKEQDIPFATILGSRHEHSGYVDNQTDVELMNLNQSDINDNWAIKRIKEGDGFYCGGGSVKASSRYGNIKSETIENLNHHWAYLEVVPFDKSFKICAPLKDMEIPTGKEVRGYKIQDIPDPVVLQPVKGGYFIVTAWGDESSDPIIVNETMN